MTFSWFGVDFRPPDPPKNGQKTRWNRSRTANPENQKNDTPPIVFASFLLPRGPEKHEKSRKIGPKMHTKIYGFFSSILKRFLVDFRPIWDPKILQNRDQNHMQNPSKKTSKNYAKNLDFGLQNGIPFLPFLATKIDPFWRRWPTRASKLKITSKIGQKSPKIWKNDSKWIQKVAQKCWKNVKQKLI